MLSKLPCRANKTSHEGSFILVIQAHNAWRFKLLLDPITHFHVVYVHVLDTNIFAVCILLTGRKMGTEKEGKYLELVRQIVYLGLIGGEAAFKLTSIWPYNTKNHYKQSLMKHNNMDIKLLGNKTMTHSKGRSFMKYYD